MARRETDKNSFITAFVARALSCSKPVLLFFAFLLVLCPVQVRAESGRATLAQWQELMEPDSSAGFETYAAFILAHPDWPSISTLRNTAEIRATGTSPSALAYFKANPPRTLAGLTACVEALTAQGDTAAVRNVIRTTWREGLPTIADQRGFLELYRAYLSTPEIHQRASRLVWADDLTLARDLMPLLDTGHRAVLAARIALRANAGNADALVGAVPTTLLQDPGLLFDRARWRNRNDNEAGAVALVRQHPDLAEGDAEDWWKLRDALARWALEQGDTASAYAIASRHGFSISDDPVPYIEAEWLAGWIALRYNGNARTALSHFTRMNAAAVSVVSKARGAYWTGRAAAALGETDKARRWYQAAAAYGTTFYGQIAAVDGYGIVTISTPADPSVPAAERQRFDSRSLVQAVQTAHKTGDRALVEKFFRALCETLSTQAEATLTVQLANTLNRRDLAAWGAKTAGRKGFIVGRAGYPVLRSGVPGAPAASVIHAIIRQESGFDPDARSPAGALGLMQLMPDTASRIARKMDTRTSASKLTNDPQHNMRLGSFLLNDLIAQYEGSLVLAAVAYNAGPGRATSWADRFGDPRSPSPPVRARLKGFQAGEPRHWIALDVIESYPFSETRFYIQQVLSNAEVYRAVLGAEGTARLEIATALAGEP